MSPEQLLGLQVLIRWLIIGGSWMFFGFIGVLFIGKILFSMNKLNQN